MKKAALVFVALALASPGHAADLDAKEIQDLNFMREEEKLAHDVYQVFSAKYRDRTFANIQRSEKKHFFAMGTLLDRYGLEDPAVSQSGVFTNPELQELYDKLVARGEKGKVAALKVGAFIEETDILDIQEAIDNTDEQASIKVYSNLLAGSGNHLAAFVGRLKKLGITYRPVALTSEQYRAIVQ